jgi:hypothetical protein
MLVGHPFLWEGCSFSQDIPFNIQVSWVIDSLTGGALIFLQCPYTMSTCHLDWLPTGSMIFWRMLLIRMIDWIHWLSPHPHIEFTLQLFRWMASLRLIFFILLYFKMFRWMASLRLIFFILLYFKICYFFQFTLVIHSTPNTCGQHQLIGKYLKKSCTYLIIFWTIFLQICSKISLQICRQQSWISKMLTRGWMSFNFLRIVRFFFPKNGIEKLMVPSWRVPLELSNEWSCQ